ncbi:MAG: hypothetical protein H0V17_24885 [Deltaproteobacteria bacterium]|nr:hypothetical protein [Deltaproteobacteria bacterium]
MRFVSFGLAAAALVSCGDNITLPPGDPGALVTVEVSSRVGVLLDDIDDVAGGVGATTRDRVVADLLARPETFWQARAALQLRLTTLRLVYRASYYDEASGKNALPLPPEEAWTITVAGSPTRQMIDGHDYVAIDYTFSSTLLTGVDEPRASDFALGRVGGSTQEDFVLPVDPTLILQRTGFACMDEEEFPPDSVDAENAYEFYDDFCEIETDLTRACHLSDLPAENCVDAVDRAIGRVDTSVVFTRIAWDDATADEFRVNPIITPDAPDLKVLTEGYQSLSNNRVVYKYFAPNDPDECALNEEPACVGGPGWRRLLTFDSIDHNVGGKPLDIGPVDYFVEGLGGELIDHNVYTLSACHNHFHFLYYGDFGFGSGTNQKVQKNGFCIESTGRLSNHELSALHTERSCENQGVDPGWVDLYSAGLTCNWVDITEVDTSTGALTDTLFFQSNPDGFMCEGELVKQEDGDQVFEPTDFTSPAGEPVDRPVCDVAEGTEDNDRGEVSVTIPKVGGAMSSPCSDDQQLGPQRNCGFTQQTNTTNSLLLTCNPAGGANDTIRCNGGSVGAQPMIVRICEGSIALGAGTDCSFGSDNMISQTVVTNPAGNTDITFACPGARDTTETGGRIAVYTAPLYEADGPAAGFICD